MTDPRFSPPLIVRLLVHLLSFRRRLGEDDVALVERWLDRSEPGRGFAQYLADEAELLAMAANRLNLTGDDDLREIAPELGNAATRLRTLVGLAAADRS